MNEELDVDLREQGVAAESGTSVLATVVASLPNRIFRLRLGDRREILAHVGLDLRMAVVRLLPGDVVEVELSPFDRHRARICRLLRNATPVQPSTSFSPPQQREQS
jgi:translation initiation factor IF-1